MLNILQEVQKRFKANQNGIFCKNDEKIFYMRSQNLLNFLFLHVPMSLILCLQYSIIEQLKKMHHQILLVVLLLFSATSDIGEIAYFESACPQGWEPYLFASERLILASGSRYAVGATDGFEAVTLTIEQIPKHNHYNQDAHGKFDGLLQTNYNGTTNAGTADQNCMAPNLNNTMPLRSAGGDQSHTNMPPYSVLNACKKVTDVKDNYCSSKQEIDQQNFDKVYQLNLIFGIYSSITSTLSLALSVGLCFMKFRKQNKNNSSNQLTSL